MKLHDALIMMKANNPDKDIYVAPLNPWSQYVEVIEFMEKNLNILDSDLLLYAKKQEDWVIIDYGMIKFNKTLRMSLIVRLEDKKNGDNKVSDALKQPVFLELFKNENRL
jgi:hypothetical protein